MSDIPNGEEDAVRLSQFGQLIRFRMQICRRNASSSFNYDSRIGMVNFTLYILYVT
jgi:hypothetical protein